MQRCCLENALKAVDHRSWAPNAEPFILTTITAGKLPPPQGDHMNETSAGRADSRPDRPEVVRQIHFTLTARELFIADIPTYQPLLHPQEVRPRLCEEALRRPGFVSLYRMPTIKPERHAGRPVLRNQFSVHDRAGSDRVDRCLHANPDSNREQFALP